MMFAFGVFISGAAIAEFQLVQNARLFEQFDRAIDSGQRNAGIARSRAGKKLFHIGVVIAVLKHGGNGAALPGHAQPLGPASFKDGVGLAHCRPDLFICDTLLYPNRPVQTTGFCRLFWAVSPLTARARTLM